MLNKFARVEKVRVAIYKFLSQVTVNLYWIDIKQILDEMFCDNQKNQKMKSKMKSEKSKNQKSFLYMCVISQKPLASAENTYETLIFWISQFLFLIMLSQCFSQSCNLHVLLGLLFLTVKMKLNRKSKK